MLIINDNIVIDDEYLSFSFARSSGPGGQNVNKVNSQAQLRFELNSCPALNSFVKNRLRNLAGNFLLADGNIYITSQESRSQFQNRQICLDKLSDLITKALTRPKVRKPTRPTTASREKRLEFKKQRSQIKQRRKMTTD